MKRSVFLSTAAKSVALTIVAGGVMKKAFSQDNGTQWQVHQFKDNGLAHFSYAILVGNKIILVDPARDALQYYRFAKENNAAITGIVETHPHADFVSSHIEIAKKTGAVIYTSSLMKPAYTYHAFDEGDVLRLSNDIAIRSIFTPGHAPDAISVMLSEKGKDKAVFTGDSLLIGDVGRPDLREYSGDVSSQRKRLAGLMYQTIWKKFEPLDDDVIVYPAHGAGSLCGKNMRDAPSSTIGYEKAHNYAFQKREEAAFVNLLLQDLPPVPYYFPYDVALNIKGAPELEQSLAQVKQLPDNFKPSANDLVIDTRTAPVFKASYTPGAYNLQNGSKFETWLGSIIAPDKHFYLVADSTKSLAEALNKTAKIGYESKVAGAYVYNETNGRQFATFNATQFDKDHSAYTIIDVRTAKEATDGKVFDNVINIPVNELEQRVKDIPTGKPIVVHCASGYRSALGSSILKKYLPAVEITDLGTDINKYLSKEQKEQHSGK